MSQYKSFDSSSGGGSGSARSKNPFESSYKNLEDDDDDNGRFGNRTSGGYSRNNDAEHDLKQIQERIGHVENESLESTYRALRSLNETREIGAKTAEELVRQGDKLNNIDERLDEVHQTLTVTQKNLNQIKSIFGGFKNKFMGSWSMPKEEASKKPAMGKSSSSVSVGGRGGSAAPPPVKADLVAITGSEREKEVHKNLEEMSMGLGHLRSLALDMQSELDRQDPIINRITHKTDIAKSRIESQNTQMKKC